MVWGVVVAAAVNNILLRSCEGGCPLLTAVLLVRITDGGQKHRVIRHSVPR